MLPVLATFHIFVMDLVSKNHYIEKKRMHANAPAFLFMPLVQKSFQYTG
jgi:hypothetical protein